MLSDGVIDWYSTVQYTLLAVHCLHTRYNVLYLVIGIATDPTVDSLHLCGEHVLAPGNYPLVIPSGCVSRAYLVQFEQSHVLKEQANTSRARAAREQSRISTWQHLVTIQGRALPLCLLRALTSPLDAKHCAIFGG